MENLLNTEKLEEPWRRNTFRLLPGESDPVCCGAGSTDYDCSFCNTTLVGPRVISSLLIQWVVHQFATHLFGVPVPLLTAHLFPVRSFIRQSPNDRTPGGSLDDLSPIWRS
ncbi:hypothetical protein C5167_015229 [Papaver somniferum]|uniref:Uncharacterized protein n=1 Tax=Papaver somniferum TaxID=3469 RepID=A0A4Y7J8I3_PAPSO|nr:hypothetical protein C5167_015229 [Papaver somniferum]